MQNTTAVLPAAVFYFVIFFCAINAFYILSRFTESQLTTAANPFSYVSLAGVIRRQRVIFGKSVFQITKILTPNRNIIFRVEEFIAVVHDSVRRTYVTCRFGHKLHKPDRSLFGNGGYVIPALDGDNGGNKRGIQSVIFAFRTDDIFVSERITNV